jgi:outer membrane protein OmpA-like peptidoglycan-associated protein
LCFITFSCSTTKEIKDGKTAYDLKKYSVAIPLFIKELSKISAVQAKAEVAMLIAECYSQINQYKEALSYYNDAEKWADIKFEIQLKKAYILKKMMRYSEAAALFQSLQNVTSIATEARQQYLVCNQFANQSAPKNLSIETVLPSEEYSDYAVSLFNDDYLLISSDRDESKGSQVFERTNRKFSDLFLCNKLNKTVISFDETLNTAYHEGTATLTKNQDVILFSRCYSFANEGDEHCKIMQSNLIEGTWSEPKPLTFQVQGINYSHPCLIENDSILIFSSKAEEESKGYDLWYAEWNGTTWSDPYPLPSVINSDANEFFPTADGDTLYFSSDHNRGYGGLDIYKTWLVNNKWQNIVLLPYPINTGADDFSFIVDRSGKQKGVNSYGYFISSRDMTGLDRLYSYKYLRNEQNDEVVVKKDDSKKQELFLALKVFTNKEIEGRKIKQKIVNAKVEIFDNNIKINEFLTDKNGFVLTSVLLDKLLTIKVGKDSFLNNLILVNTSINTNEDTYTFNKEVELQKLERNKEIILHNIYYDLDKWDIRDDAKPALDELFNILIQNPSISISLGSHTDCRGDDQYNMELSSKRANSAVQYLISKGIDKSRLFSVGYGETITAVSCDCMTCTEDQHQANRRTTFKIL